MLWAWSTCPECREPPLDGLIDDLYYLEGAPPYARLTLPPMPSALLIVNLGAPFRIRAGTDIETAEYADGCVVTTPTRALEFGYPLRTRSVGVPARTSRPHAGRLAAAGRLISYKSESSRHANFGAPKAEERPVGKVVMYASVSVDGFIADENDQPGPLFDWLLSGDVPLDESGVLKVSQTSYDYTRPYWDQIGATIAGRHVFDMTDGWDGKPPGGVDHVVVVTHRPEPEGWDPEAPFHFVDGVEAAVAKAQELAGDRMVEVAAGDVGGQVLAAGLIDEVRMDVVPVVFGSGKRYFGSVHAQHLLEDPDVVIQSNRVLHLRYRVRR